MRLTLVLGLPQRVKRLKNASWQRWRKRGVITHTVTENNLREAGITVYDPNEYLRTHKDNPLYIDYDSIPEVKPVFPVEPKLDKSHPNWNDIPCRIFDDSSFPIEGIRQSQVFSKSVQIKQGLPDHIMEFGFSSKIDDQDNRVQQIIKQAFLWDAYLEKLPNLRNHDLPVYIFRLLYGIPNKRSNEILARNFLQLIETALPNVARNRILSGKNSLCVNMERHDNLVQFQLTPMLTLMSKFETKPYADSKVVSGTTEIELPNIHPFKSTANIEDSNIYVKEDSCGFKENNPFPFIHTTFFSHHIPGSHTHIHPRWNDDRFTGTTNMYAFATALRMARQKFGADVKTLDEPVTTHIVHLTGREVQFAVFQLNTLDLEGGSGSHIKNILWITEKLRLFEECKYDMGKELFTGYNPDVFKMLLGIYGTSSSNLVK